MQNQAERVPFAVAYFSDAVTEGRSCLSARARRPQAIWEDDRVAEAQWNDVRNALLAWPLLDEDEIAAGELASRLAQENRSLQRKGDLTVDVLVERVVIARALLEHACGRARLAAGCTQIEHQRERRRKTYAAAERSHLVVCNADERSVERFA